MKKSVRKLISQLTVQSFVIVCLLLTFIFVFAYIAHEAVYENETAFDKSVGNFLSLHSSPATIQLMRGFTFLGSFYFLAPAYLMLTGYYVFNKKYGYAICILIISLSSTLVMFGLKQLFHRQRPSLPLVADIAGYSFPSGHSLSAFIFCSIAAYIVRKEFQPGIWKWILILLLLVVAFIVGISRIVLNVHYATDVIASFCLGIVWVLVSFTILKKWI